jgi:hypothetical protein
MPILLSWLWLMLLLLLAHAVSHPFLGVAQSAAAVATCNN